MQVQSWITKGKDGGLTLSLGTFRVILNALLSGTVQALLDPGDECVFFEPHFPWYPTATRMAGGVPKVSLLIPETSPSP